MKQILEILQELFLQINLPNFEKLYCLNSEPEQFVNNSVSIMPTELFIITPVYNERENIITKQTTLIVSDDAIPIEQMDDWIYDWIFILSGFIILFIILYIQYIIVEYYANTKISGGRYKYICRGKSQKNKRCKRCVKNKDDTCFQH